MTGWSLQNGRWMADESRVSDRNEIYVEQYPCFKAIDIAPDGHLLMLRSGPAEAGIGAARKSWPFKNGSRS
jgi:hypothetical protein